MPFPATLTAAELDTVRATDTRTVTNLAYCAQTVIFAARVATGIVSGVFAEVEFDTVTVGAFGDIKPGMTVYFGVGSDIRYAYLVTRARKAAASGTIYIAEAASVLQDGDYITVVDDYDLREKLLRIASDGTIYADWDITFKKPAPLIGNLQSAYIDPRPSGDATLTFSPTGYPIAQDATTSLTWLWDVGDGTITVGSSSTQQITATFPQGQRFIRVTVTDSNSVAHTRVMWVNVGLTNTIQDIDNPPVTSSLSDGWNLSLETWDRQSATILRSLPESTLCVLYTAQIYGDGSTAPIVTNIDCIGRTRSERSHSLGDALWSTLQTGSLEIEGFASQLNRLSSPQLSIRHDTTPTVWGEVNQPTPVRFIGHLGTYFSTLWSLCSPQLELPFTYRATTANADATVTVADTSILLPGMGVSGTGIPGSTTILSITNKTTFELSANATASATNTLVFTPEYVDSRFISASLTLTETSAGAAYDRVAKWFNAGLSYCVSGEIALHRHAFYLTGSEKSGLATIADCDGDDALEYTNDIVYPDTIGRAFTGAEFFNTTLNETRYITGSAPPVARGNGEGQATEDGQILEANTDDGSVITELNVRTASLYAASQPLDKLSILFYDGWRGVVIPCNFRWWTFTIVAANNTMGRIYTDSTRWLCDGVSYNYLLETGEIGIRATFIKEPTVGAAQVASAISPALVEPAIPDLPAFSPYPGMDLSGGINYPTDGIPDLEDMQPIDSYSSNLGDEEAAGNFPPPGCRNYNVLMNDSTGVTTAALTNAATYTVRASGSGQISTGGWVHFVDLTGAALPTGWIIDPSAADIGSFVAGSGILPGAAVADLRTARVAYTFASPVDITAFRISITACTVDSFGQVFSPNPTGTTFAYNFDLVPGSTTHVDATGLPETFDAAQFAAGFVWDTLAGTEYLTGLLIQGTGINPFTGGTGDVHADAFYYFDPTNPNEGFPYTGYGLTFDGGEPNTIPPYSTNHVYNTTITGTGSGSAIKFSDTVYTDNAASTIKVRICGAGL